MLGCYRWGVRSRWHTLRAVVVIESRLIWEPVHAVKAVLGRLYNGLTFTQHWRRFVGGYLARSDQLIRVAVEEEFALRNGRRGCSIRCVSSQHQ